MELQLYQVDAFTHGKHGTFTGNPAAVVLVPKSAAALLTDKLRQKVAAENNLSETAFLEWDDDAGPASATSRFSLRWFTPAVEVPLCGHATLASAAALFIGEGNSCSRLDFDTLSGKLSVARISTRKASGSGGGDSGESGATQAADLLAMDLPLIEAAKETVPPGMEAGSELVKVVVGDLEVQDVLYAAPLKYLLVALRDGEAARAAFSTLSPDAQRLGAAHGGGLLTGVIVTVQGEPNGPHDFFSRFFAPWAGIAEDPVTGSAHSVLGPYWHARLGTAQMRARQASARGGELQLEVDAAAGRVTVAGRAAIVIRGRLLLPVES